MQNRPEPYIYVVCTARLAGVPSKVRPYTVYKLKTILANPTNTVSGTVMHTVLNLWLQSKGGIHQKWGGVIVSPRQGRWKNVWNPWIMPMDIAHG